MNGIEPAYQVITNKTPAVTPGFYCAFGSA
jgi:hypothetical protein